MDRAPAARNPLALYAAGLALPEVDPDLDTREEPFFDQNARRMLREQLTERFGCVADPESRGLALADDLAGLYVAVKEGLLKIPEHSGRVPAHVIWGWTLGFENDSGRHAISAISVLLSQLFGSYA